jgi:hypothetical protein
MRGPLLPPSLVRIRRRRRAALSAARPGEDLHRHVEDFTAVDELDHLHRGKPVPSQPVDSERVFVTLGLGDGPQPELPATAPRPPHSRTPTATRRRSAAELLDAAHEVRSEHTRQRKQARAQARRDEQLARESHLDHLAENAEQAWQDIANLIGKKQPGPYDAAVTLLKDLHEVHDRAGAPEEFARRLHDLREQHRGKPSLMQRLTDAGLTTR